MIIKQNIIQTQDIALTLFQPFVRLLSFHEHLSSSWIIGIISDYFSDVVCGRLCTSKALSKNNHIPCTSSVASASRVMDEPADCVSSEFEYWQFDGSFPPALSCGNLYKWLSGCRFRFQLDSQLAGLRQLLPCTSPVEQGPTWQMTSTARLTCPMSQVFSPPKLLLLIFDRETRQVPRPPPSFLAS